MATEHELEVLARHSTPGLRKNQLDREGKRNHLGGIKVSPRDAEKLLDELYPPEAEHGRG